MSHYEISPREREDEQERDRRDFDTQELADQDEQDRISRQQGVGAFDDE